MSLKHLFLVLKIENCFCCCCCCSKCTILPTASWTSFLPSINTWCLGQIANSTVATAKRCIDSMRTRESRYGAVCELESLRRRRAAPHFATTTDRNQHISPGLLHFMSVTEYSRQVGTYTCISKQWSSRAYNVST